MLKSLANIRIHYWDEVNFDVYYISEEFNPDDLGEFHIFSNVIHDINSELKKNADSILHDKKNYYLNNFYGSQFNSLLDYFAGKNTKDLLLQQ